MMLFKPMTIDEALVEVEYLQNIGYRKRQQSGSIGK
jgi:hypothetical protein